MDLPGVSRAMCWRLPRTHLEFGRRPLLMGIVNVTPDSFSDGGRYLDPQAAVEHALRLEAEGAAILDIGGESTRPYAQPVEAAEELRRVMPVIRELSQKTSLPISIDTHKAEVAREAIAAGAQIVNDVTALRGDSRMIEVLLETGAAVCLMHMQGTPQTMQDNPVYQNVVAEVAGFLEERLRIVQSAGVPRERVAIDPGIGFGKRLEHNLMLLREIDRFHSLGCAILVGHSRKRFIAELIGDFSADRLPGTVAVALALARKGVQILRVHDVGAVAQALRVFEAVTEGDPSPVVE